MYCRCDESLVTCRLWCFESDWLVYIQSSINFNTTFSDGCLGSRNDEGRSHLRYAVWLANFWESLDFWTQKVLHDFVMEYVHFSAYDFCCFNWETTWIEAVCITASEILSHVLFGEALESHANWRLNKPEFEQDYPLNLSILLSGGRETN
jgi:hypothetical protein